MVTSAATAEEEGCPFLVGLEAGRKKEVIMYDDMFSFHNAARRWRESDPEHCCSFCERCKGDYNNGYHCESLEGLMSDNRIPVRRVMLDDIGHGICDFYECNHEKFYAEMGRHPGEKPATQEEENGVRPGVDFPETHRRPNYVRHVA